jgi:Amt family ammonium transporter
MANATETDVNNVWVLVCAILVLLMTPGLALFYGGFSRAKNAVSVMIQVLVALGMMSLYIYLHFCLATIQ